jgi:alpha-1,2-rhamnosyltransferase
VIVGRQSWMMPAFLERVARHPQRDRRLFVLRDASDAELDHCYRQASALVIASEIEGFGLPIVEAFQRGLPVLCSDIAVFREIADGRATFFNLSDPGHLANALSEFCRRVAPGARRQRDPQGWIGWRESTEQLFAAIIRALPGPQGASPRVSQQHGG